ncbi:MAG: hypothetical protein ACI31S_01340 [Bacilli bacterium]
MEKINFNDMCHLFGEKIVNEWANTEYNIHYIETKNNKNRYTLYRKSTYGDKQYGFSYGTVANGKKNIEMFIKNNNLAKIIY